MLKSFFQKMVATSHVKDGLNFTAIIEKFEAGCRQIATSMKPSETDSIVVWIYV